MSKPFSISFGGFEELIKDLEGLNGDVDKAVEDGLKAGTRIVAEKLEKDMKKHRRTGETERSIIKETEIEWNGTVAHGSVGFKIKDGNKVNLRSIFLMYGTPKVKKDTKLYNDVYGAATRKKIMEEQKKIFEKAIAERMG